MPGAVTELGVCHLSLSHFCHIIPIPCDTTDWRVFMPMGLDTNFDMATWAFLKFDMATWGLNYVTGV